MTIYIGDIPIHYVSSFDTDRSLKNIEEIHFLGIDSIPYLSEQTSHIRDFGMIGTLLQDSGVASTINDMAEDILALKNRRSQFNYIHDFQNRSGWLGIKEAGSDKNASSLVTRPYVLSGKFLPKALYQTRMHSHPIIRPNDFSFTLGIDDCDNYIAIPIGSTYLGGDGSTITRTSEDGEITLIKATTNTDIVFDIDEADVDNGEVKLFDEMITSDEDQWIQVFNTDRTFVGHKIIQNGLYRLAISDGDPIQVTIENTATNVTVTNSGQTFNPRVGGIDTITAVQIKVTATTAPDTATVSIYDSPGGTLLGAKTINTPNNGYFIATFDHPIGIIGDNMWMTIVGSTGLWKTSQTDTSSYAYGDKTDLSGNVVAGDLYFIIYGNKGLISLSRWDTSDYTLIDNFIGTTYRYSRILDFTPDLIEIGFKDNISVELSRGHPPMIDTAAEDLVCCILDPSNQSTTTENYLVLDTSVYVCSDESFNIVNATKNLDDGKKWIFYETVSATAEDIAHQAMVKARQTRELVQK